MTFSKIFIWVLIFLVATQGRAHAYTDPGSGSLILQMLFAASFGLLFYARRVVTWLRGLKTRKSTGQYDEQ